MFDWNTSKNKLINENGGDFYTVQVTAHVLGFPMQKKHYENDDLYNMLFYRSWFNSGGLNAICC